MKKQLINLLFTSLILLLSCSPKIDKSKIAGSWYFVDYADKPYSKTELNNFDEDIKSSPKGWIKSFNYIFEKDSSYEYIIYNALIHKGTYSVNKNDYIILRDTIESKNDTLKIKYLDDKFLQVIHNDNERVFIYYKTNKLPKVEVITTE